MSDVHHPVVDVPTDLRPVLEGAGVGDVARCELVRHIPWSYVVRLVLEDGAVLWAKRCGPTMRVELALTRILVACRASEACMVDVVAVADDWIVTVDGGPRLQRDGANDNAAAILQLQPNMAMLQRQLCAHVDELAAAQVPVLDPARVPRIVEHALRWTERHGQLASTPLTPSEAVSLRRRGDELAAQLELLISGAAGFDRVLLHLDTHHGNTFWDGARARLIDWGDARLGTPYLHAISTTYLLARTGGLDFEDPRIARVRDTYLDAWPELDRSPDVLEVLGDPRLSALIRLDSFLDALDIDAAPEALAPLADWIPRLARAAGAADPRTAAHVALA